MWCSGVHIAPVVSTQQCCDNCIRHNRECTNSSRPFESCISEKFVLWEARYKCKKNAVICGFNLNGDCTIANDRCESKVDKLDIDKDMMLESAAKMKDLFK